MFDENCAPAKVSVAVLEDKVLQFESECVGETPNIKVCPKIRDFLKLSLE